MVPSKLESFLLAFLILLIAIVFWQVYTDMTRAGIASGGPLDNAAAYPRTLAIILGVLIVIRLILKIVQSNQPTVENTYDFLRIKRPILLLIIFSLYLFGLSFLGYHLTTPAFLFSVLYLAGERKYPSMVISSFMVTLTIAFIFEVLLKVVLPGGLFRINIPW